MNTGMVLRSLLVVERRPGSSLSRFRLGWSASMYQFRYRWPFTLSADGSDHCLAIITFTGRRVSGSIPASRRLRVVGRKSWHPLHNSSCLPLIEQNAGGSLAHSRVLALRL